MQACTTDAARAEADVAGSVKEHRPCMGRMAGRVKNAVFEPMVSYGISDWDRMVLQFPHV